MTVSQTMITGQVDRAENGTAAEKHSTALLQPKMTATSNRQVRFIVVGLVIWLYYASVTSATDTNTRRQLQHNTSFSGSSSVVSEIIASQPSRAKPCVALNDLQFQRQILLTFQGRPRQITTSDIRLLQSSFLKAYNSIASCSNGAGQRITQVIINRNQVNSYGATITPTASDNVTQQFTFIATISGVGIRSQASPFRLFSNATTPTATTAGRRQQHRSETYGALAPRNSSSRSETREGAGAQRKKKGPTPMKVPPTVCQCPLPSKLSFVKLWNKITPKPASVNLMVTLTELDKYTPCNPVETSFQTTISIQFADVALLSNNTQFLSSQYVLLEQAVLQTYNDINALNIRDVCDPLFLTIADVKLVSAFGSTGLNRRRRSRELGAGAATSTTSSSKGGYIFNVTGLCHGCSTSLPPLFDNSATGQRRRTMEIELRSPMKEADESEYEMMDVAPVPPFATRRRVPIINDACYCPVGATMFRRPTQTEFYQALNLRLALLGPQGYGLITVVSMPQDSLQVIPVNCSAQVNFFSSLVAINFVVNGDNATLNPGDTATLAQSIQDSYNTLAQQFCDPLFRTVAAVAHIGEAPSRRRVLHLAETSRGLATTSRNRTSSVTVTLSFSVRGRCRGCTKTTPLFNDVSGRLLEMITSESMSHLEPIGFAASERTVDHYPHHYGQRQQQHRQLQQDSNQTSLCYCSANFLGSRAPDVAEFTAAYNQTVATALNTSVSVATVDASKTLPPISTPSPSSSPSILHTPEPSRKPTFVVAVTAPPTLTPSQKPVVVSTVPPTTRPVKPTLPPQAPPTLSPLQPFAADPFSQPAPLPTFPPSLMPVPPPSLKPVPPPSVMPVPPPSLKPVPPPSVMPMPPPSVKPLPPPSVMPLPPPSKGPTQQPTPLITDKPTKRPRAPPFLPPTPEPSQPPTPEPSPPPTLNPSPPPTPNPSPPPTPNPSPPPTPNPSPPPTPNPSPPPTLNPSPPPTSNPSSEPVPPPVPPPSPPPTIQPTLPTTTRHPTPRPSPFPSPSPFTPSEVPHTAYPVYPIFPVFFPSLPTFLNPTSRPR